MKSFCSDPIAKTAVYQIFMSTPLFQAHEMDGFQADTEEDEDEADCVIIRTQKGETSK